jgi:hypothetical protein
LVVAGVEQKLAVLDLEAMVDQAVAVEDTMAIQHLVAPVLLVKVIVGL